MPDDTRSAQIEGSSRQYCRRDTFDGEWTEEKIELTASAEVPAEFAQLDAELEDGCPEPIRQFRAQLEALAPGVLLTVDAPDNPAGEHWLDIAAGEYSTAVAWRPEYGFGIYTELPVFSEGPNEIYPDAREAVVRLLEVEPKLVQTRQSHNGCHWWTSQGP